MGNLHSKVIVSFDHSQYEELQPFKVLRADGIVNRIMAGVQGVDPVSEPIISNGLKPLGFYGLA